MDLELNGKRALVTGGSSGIGLAIARSLALEGADVAIASRKPEKLAQTVASLKAETGGRIIGPPVDTGNDSSVAENRSNQRYPPGVGAEATCWR